MSAAAIVTVTCDICDGEELRADSLPQQDGAGNHCGWICRDCWNHRPCAECGGDVDGDADTDDLGGICRACQVGGPK